MSDVMTDSAGKTSTMRVMNMLSLLAAIGIAASQVFGLGVPGEDNTHLIIWFLVGAFVPKSIQAAIEHGGKKLKNPLLQPLPAQE